METYSTYKDSGIEWIGEIPIEWNVARLRYRGKSIIGITYKPEQVSDETNGTLVLRSSNVQNGKLDFKDCVYVDKKIQENQLTREGDILVCARNGSAHLVGKCAYIPKEWENVSFGAFMSIVRTDLDKFLYYYFNSQVFKGQKGLFATSTINQLTSSMLNNLDIPIPPTKEEQTAIANYLDRKTAELDIHITDKKRLVKLYEEEKTAVINKAVTKGVSSKVKLKDSGIEWLGDIPEHWSILPIKYTLSTPVTDGPHETPKLYSEGIPFISAEAIKKDKIDFSKKRGFISEEEHKRFSLKYKPQRGDVYMIKSGATTGNLAIVETDIEFNIWSPLAAFRPNYNMLMSKFLFYFMKSKSFFSAIEIGWNYGTQQNIGMKVLENIRMVLPSLEEQNQIVELIELENKKIDSKIYKAKKYIKLLTEYRTALISEVVTGKIKVID
jgi:type I restriction enzyme S subunit